MSEFKSKMKSNLYNTKQLEINNEEYSKIISENRIQIREHESSLKVTIEKIKDANLKKEEVLGKRYVIDEEITKVNPITLKKEIDDLTNKGVSLNQKLTDIKKEIEEIPKFSYDEQVHDELREEEKKLMIIKNNIEIEIKNLELTILNLKEGEICPTCKRSLEEVDHTVEIKEKEELVETKKSELDNSSKLLSDTQKKLLDISEEKKNSDLFDRLGMSKDKTDIEIDKMRVEYKEKNNLLKDYEKNSTFIEENRKLESTILGKIIS